LVLPVCSSQSISRSDANPAVGGCLNLVSAAWINWFNAILFGTLFVLEIFFMPETLYPRTLMLTRMPKTPSPSSSDIEQPQSESKPTTTTNEDDEDNIPRTKSLPYLNIFPIPGLKTPALYTTITRFLYTFTLPIIPLSVLGYSFLWYWWVLSVITMVPAAYPQYSPLIQGLLFLGLLLGTVISEICCSGRLSDLIVKKLAKRNGGVRVAEMRIWLAFPAIVLTAGMSSSFFLLLYGID
jgi:hypothetical protein